MHLVFGMAADGRPYPEYPGRENGALGAAVVGPAGMLELLGAQLGLGAPPSPLVERIVAWQNKLEAAEADGSPRFWSASFQADAWSSARLTLSWRDALTEAGWSPDRLPEASGRLADLAAAETAGPALPRGRPDLLREIIHAVKNAEPTDVATVELIEDEALLPPGWRELMMVLREAGVAVKRTPAFVPVEAGTDIGKVHRFLRSGERIPLSADGTVAEVEADTALAAAECVAEWIASGPGDPTGETVIVAPDGDSALLDQAFARHGLPAIGLSASSAYRGVLQVLPLAFATAWKPFDPGKLLELLLLPRPPIQRWAARTLARAISDEPGVGGAAWQQAWNRIEDELRERAAKDATVDVVATLKVWRDWMEVGRFDRKLGMPASDALAICQRVLEWAVTRDGGARDPLILCLVGAARALQRALAKLERTPVTSLQIDRMIDQAVAEGLPNPHHCCEEGHIRAVSTCGALWGSAARVVWWNFTEPSSTASSFPWSIAEQTALAAAGCCPERPGEAARRDAFHWQNVVLHSQSAILFVRPALNRGTETASHPLEHQLGSLFRMQGALSLLRTSAERLLIEERVPLAAREIIRAATVTVGLPKPQPLWKLPEPLASRAAGRHESASSLEDLLACQMRWVLKHVAGLRSSREGSVPDSERLFGILAHALAEIAFIPGRIPNPLEVRARAEAEIDGLLGKIAAPLLMPGLAKELAFARKRIPEALSTLAEILADRNLTVEALELEQDGEFGDLRVRSRIDMVVRDAAQQRSVVDLKWSRRDKRRREELKDGRAIQLATYSRLVAPRGAPAGYFLIRQQRLLAEAGSPLARDGIGVSRTLDETWDAITMDWRALSQMSRDGLGISYGIDGAETHLPESIAFTPREKPCGYCDFTRVCRSPAAA